MTRVKGIKAVHKSASATHHETQPFITIIRFERFIALNLKKKQRVMTTQEIIKFIEERKDSAVYIFKAVSNSDRAQESTKMFSHGEMYALTTILEEIKQRMEQPTSKVEVLNGMQQYFKEKNLL